MTDTHATIRSCITQDICAASCSLAQLRKIYRRFNFCLKNKQLSETPLLWELAALDIANCSVQLHNKHISSASNLEVHMGPMHAYNFLPKHHCTSSLHQCCIAAQRQVFVTQLMVTCNSRRCSGTRFDQIPCICT